MKVATYNAASIRPRMPLILDWVAVNEPDILVVQETKVEDDKFPRGDFEDLGYHVALHGVKSWNGVATISRHPISNVRQGFCDELFPQDGRLLSCTIEGLHVINTYVPNGSAVGSEKFEYKLRWLDRFRQYLDECYRPDEPLIWMGDINIAPKAEDVYNPKRFYGGVGHHPEEMSRLEGIKEFGLTDLFRKFHTGPGYYTYWDFVIVTSVAKNFGWRIDHIYGTKPVAEACTECVIDRDARLAEKPSDHTFVVATIDL